MSRLKIAGVAAALLAIYGSWLLLRDAPLFAVQKVAVVGLQGPQAPTIRTTLEDAARAMTTTHLELGRLRAAVATFAIVKDVRAQTRFPHGVSIQVIQELPVAALVVAGQRLPVAADGRIVRGIGTAPDVASVAVDQLPTGGQISDPLSIEAVELLDIAPPVLRARVAQVTDGAHGLTAGLRRGPSLYFGDTTRLHAKWAAVARVLADPTSRGARYLDVHAPDHPAAQIGDAPTGVAPAGSPGTAAGTLAAGTAPAGTAPAGTAPAGTAPAG